MWFSGSGLWHSSAGIMSKTTSALSLPADAAMTRVPARGPHLITLSVEQWRASSMKMQISVLRVLHRDADGVELAVVVGRRAVDLSRVGLPFGALGATIDGCVASLSSIMRGPRMVMRARRGAASCALLVPYWTLARANRPSSSVCSACVPCGEGLL